MTSQSEAWRQADRLFSDLLELEPEERERALVLGHPSGEVEQLVRRLLAAEVADGPLDRPLLVTAAGSAEPNDLAGRRLGVYRLIEELGRGGMAVVYRAERDAGDFEQLVAIKVLGLGLIPTAAERFRREQQVLARLQHPGIARILDGGVAADGTPYLVMELVDGARIDTFCSSEGLSPAQIVQLMVKVCEAVSYAHRNLVVHRDLKPGNILVGSGGPKLLDFGIAKLLDPETGELTRREDRLLTPAYAAPEQLVGDDVTLATDVFALGVILDQLLFGGALSGREPGGAIKAAIAVGDDRDLANVVRMAVREEPDRRYEDARALGADLANWLQHRPVSATRDSWSYRARKWLVRRRGWVAFGATLVTLLVAGVVSTLVQARRARLEARTAAAVSTFLVDLFSAGDPAAVDGEDPPASELLRRGARRARADLVGEPLVQAQLLHTIGGIQREIGQLEAAEDSLLEAWRVRRLMLGERDAGTVSTEIEVAMLRHEQGAIGEAIRMLQGAVLRLGRSSPQNLLVKAQAEIWLADLLVEQGDAEAAIAHLQPLLAALPEEPEFEALRLQASWSLGAARGLLGEWEVALVQLEEVVELERRRSPRGSAHLVSYLNDLGITAFDAGRLDQSRAALLEALDLARHLFGPNHPVVGRTLSSLGSALEADGEFELAIRYLAEGVEVATRAYGESHPETASAHGALANALARSGDNGAALLEFEHSTRIWRSLESTNNGLASGAFMSQHGSLLARLGRPAEAFEVVAEAQQRLAGELPPGHYRLAVAEALLAEADVGLGRPQVALTRLDRAVPVMIATWGEGSTKVCWAQLAAARAHLSLGQVAEARALRPGLKADPTDSALVEALARFDDDLAAMP